MLAIANVLCLEIWLTVSSSNIGVVGVTIVLLLSMAFTMSIDFAGYWGRVCSFLAMAWYYGSLGRLFIKFDTLIETTSFPMNEILAISAIAPVFIFLIISIVPHTNSYNWQYIKGKVSRVR